MIILTSKERAGLRSQANTIPAILHVGKEGVTPELTQSVDEALEARELVKIDVLDNCSEDTKEVAALLHERTRSEIVQVIGRKIVLYRVSRKKKSNTK